MSRFTFEKMLPARSRRGYLAVLVLLVAVIPACGRSGRGGVDVYPVEGVVRYQGKPAADALVVFHPKDASEKLQRLRPAGSTDAQGRFLLSTYGPNDGAPAGEYRVTIIWASPGVDEQSGPDRLGGRYANPQDSPLTATVAAGDNSLEPFDLK